MKGSSWELETTSAISRRSKKPTRYQRPGVGVRGTGAALWRWGFPEICVVSGLKGRKFAIGKAVGATTRLLGPPSL